jgi:hypothetical protein
VVSDSPIEALAYQFAEGYYDCTGPNDPTTVLTLAVGTNNSLDVSQSYGNAWGQLVNAVASQTSGFSSPVLVWGGSDLEPSWSSWPDVQAWITGFAAANPPLYLNDGSADGCPRDTDDNGGCNNGWDQYDVWYASWGAPLAAASPEIYYAADATEWALISEYGAVYQGGHAIEYEGPLDEYDLNSDTITSAQAWDDLANASNHYGVPFDPPYSLEVHSPT